MHRTPDSAHPASFRLGAVTVDPMRNRLRGPDGEILLEPKVMAVLVCLAARPGTVMTRSELIDSVWGVEHGGDESLTRAISLLRKALGGASSIETISRRGYRLNAAVTPAEDVGPAPSAPRALPPVSLPLLISGLAAVAAALAVAAWLWLVPHPAREEGITLMVQPFTATGGAPETSALARELADDLTDRISGFSLNRVIAAPYAPGRHDRLTYVLTGDVRDDDRHTRVAVQLTEAGGGARLWSQTYDRPLAGAAEDDLVTVIASEVQPSILIAAKSELERRPLNSLRPWQLNLLVTWVPGAEESPSGPPSENSFWLQKRALSLDPDYAPAHATYAEMLAYHALFDPPSDTEAQRNRARDHAERALQLAPYNAEVLYHVATYYRFSGDRERAEALLKRVLALQPSYLVAQADLDLVEGQCQTDPSSQIASLEALRDRLSPANPARWLILSHLADLNLGRGDLKAAAAYAGQSRDIVKTTWSSLTLATARAASGDRKDLTAIVHETGSQWTHLSYATFAGAPAARWCLNGPRTGEVQAYFRSLAAELAG